MRGVYFCSNGVRSYSEPDRMRIVNISALLACAATACVPLGAIDARRAAGRSGTATQDHETKARRRTPSTSSSTPAELCHPQKTSLAARSRRARSERRADLRRALGHTLRLRRGRVRQARFSILRRTVQGHEERTLFAYELIPRRRHVNSEERSDADEVTPEMMRAD